MDKQEIQLTVKGVVLTIIMGGALLLIMKLADYFNIQVSKVVLMFLFLGIITFIADKCLIPLGDIRRQKKTKRK